MATLGRAIESVLSQNSIGNTIEILIVDDGSTDQTGTIATQYVQAYPDRIRLIHQHNQGPAATRNTGIAAAVGELIAFLDADDWWLPGKLASQLRVLEEKPEVALVCTTMNGHSLWGKPAVIILRFRDLLWSNKVYTSSVLARKTILLAAGCFNPQRRLCEDYELWLSIGATHPIALLNTPYLMYSKGIGTSSRLWAMERAELKTYAILKQRKLVSGPIYTILRYWSLAKYMIRVVQKFALGKHFI